MLIIEYKLGYKNQIPTICCGEFRDFYHFEMFSKVENFAGRIVHCVLSITQKS